MSEALEIYYDGDCPFCAAYTRMLRLRATVGRVELIDARGDDPRLAELRALGVDFNQGMAVRHGGRLWLGAEAMGLLAVLSEEGGILRAVMRSPRRAASCCECGVWSNTHVGQGAAARSAGLPQQ